MKECANFPAKRELVWNPLPEQDIRCNTRELLWWPIVGKEKIAFALTWAKRAKTIGLMPEKHMEFINPTKTIKFGVTVLCIVDWKTSRVMKSSRVWVTNNDGVLRGVAVGRLKMVETCPSLELPRLFFSSLNLRLTEKTTPDKQEIVNREFSRKMTQVFCQLNDLRVLPNIC